MKVERDNVDYANYEFKTRTLQTTKIVCCAIGPNEQLTQNDRWNGVDVRCCHFMNMK